MHVSFAENTFGNDSIFVIATSIHNESMADTILVSVASVNDAPIISSAGYFVTDEEDSIHVRKILIFSDVDNDVSDLFLVMDDGAVVLSPLPMGMLSYQILMFQIRYMSPRQSLTARLLVMFGIL